MSEEIKHSSYTEAQKKATKKYRENNKEKVNIQRKKYYQNRKDKDPTFLEYKRTKAREYYQKKKNHILKESNVIVEQNPLNLSEALEIVKEDFLKKLKEEIIEVEPIDVENSSLIIEQIPIDETTQEKKKRKYNKKTI